jgi:hypothetical protein
MMSRSGAVDGVSHWIPEQVPEELAGYILERIRT